MKVLDTSFLVSLYLATDENHSKAVALAKENSFESLLISDVIFFEFLTVLNYRAGIIEARKAHDELLNNKFLTLVHFSENEKAEILNLFFSRKKLSIADCSVLYLVKRHNIEALCFDEGIK